MDERGYRGVVGHKDIIRHLVNAAANDKVSHAYLLTGEKGSGKKLLASIFAAALNRPTAESPALNVRPATKRSPETTRTSSGSSMKGRTSSE